MIRKQIMIANSSNKIFSMSTLKWFNFWKIFPNVVVPTIQKKISHV